MIKPVKAPRIWIAKVRISDDGDEGYRTKEEIEAGLLVADLAPSLCSNAVEVDDVISLEEEEEHSKD